MSEDKSKTDERDEREGREDDEPDVEAHRFKARVLGPEKAADPGARAKRPPTH